MVANKASGATKVPPSVPATARSEKAADEKAHRELLGNQEVARILRTGGPAPADVDLALILGNQALRYGAASPPASVMSVAKVTTATLEEKLDAAAAPAEPAKGTGVAPAAPEVKPPAPGERPGERKEGPSGAKAEAEGARKEEPLPQGDRATKPADGEKAEAKGDKPPAAATDEAKIAVSPALAASTTAATGGEGAGDMVGAWSGRVHASVNAMSTPKIPPSTKYTGGISSSGAAATAKWQKKAEQIPKEAKRVLEAKPIKPLAEIPPMPSPDPVPQATEKVRSKSVRELPDQKLPDLIKTPHGFMPTVGGVPVDTKVPLPSATTPAGPAPVAKTPVDAVNQAVAKTPDVNAVSGQGQTIKGSERPPQFAIAAPHRADLAKVLARVYLEAGETADTLVHDARAQAYGVDLNAHSGLKDLGSDLVTAESGWLQQEMRRVADAAQIGTKALDDAVSARKKQLDEQKKQCSADVNNTANDQNTNVNQKAADTQATIKLLRQSWNAHWDSIAAAAKGGVDPKAVREEQAKLSEVLRKHAADHLVAWQGMLKERNKKLDRALEDQLTAYKDAALSDEGGQKQASIVELTDEEIKKWLADRSREIRHSVGMLKENVKNIVEGWQAEMRVARDDAVDMVREWADKRIGREDNWLLKLLSKVLDALENKHEETNAFADDQTATTVADLGQDLQVLNDLKTKGFESLDRDEKDHLRKMDQDQQALLKGYFEGPDKGDTVLFLAKMLQIRLRKRRLPEVIKQIREKVLALDNVANWQDLEVIGASQTSGFSAQTVADQLWQAFEYTWGTDEDKAYAAVKGLTAEQGKAVRGVYRADHGEDLDTRLASEMSDEEYDRVKYGLEGKQAEADAAALRDAVEGPGTDEDLINQTLRNKTPAERLAIAEAYKSLYGEDLTSRLHEELSGDEQAITDAHLEGNTEKADAIEVKSAKEAFWGPDQDKIEKVYTRVHEEAASVGDARGWTSSEIDAEIARRTGKMGTEYKDYTKRDLLPDLDAAFRPPADASGDPAQREYADQYWNGRRDLVLGMATGDLTRADAGKIQIERTGLYAKDDTINAVLGLQYDRAFQREKRDALVLFSEQHEGRAPTKEEQKQLEAEASERAQNIGKQKMTALGNYFETNYTKGTEKFSDTIKDLTQFTGEEKAVALMNQGGYLKDWQILEFATKGLGTDDDAFKKLLKSKKTKAEQDQLEKDWQKNTGHTESVTELIEDETSGRLKNDLLLDNKYGGDPEDPAVVVEKAKEQLDFEKRSGGVDYVPGPDGKTVEVKNHEYQVLEKRLARLQTQAAAFEAAKKLPEDDPSKTWATLKWQASQAGYQSAIDTHRAMVDQRTELAAQIASLVVAVVVGVILTVVTAGAATPGVIAAIAAISSAFGAAAGIAIKASMKGAAYGADELTTDIIMGVVDVIVSAATAGVGDKILKAGKTAAKLGSKGLLATIGRMAEGNVAKRAAAHFVTHGAEGFLQSLPTSVLGTVINKQTWEQGNPLWNLLSGVGTGVGLGTLASGSIGALSNLRKGAHVTVPTEEGHLLGSRTGLVDAHGDPVKVHELEARYFEANPTRTKADFRRDFDAILIKQAEHDPDIASKLQRQLRDEVGDLLPPHHKAQLEGCPVEMWDTKRFEQFSGSETGQAMVIIKDGQPTVIVKQGADPHALAEEGFHLMQAVDPKTKAKVARLNEDVLSRWGQMDPRERLQLYSEKLELEIDAQKQVIGALEARGAQSGIADRLAMAKGTLENLEKRLGEMHSIGPFQRTLMGWGVLRQPEWLDQPARLFSKKDLRGPLPVTSKGIQDEIAGFRAKGDQITAGERLRLARLEAEFDSRFHPAAGEKEPPVFKQDPGESLADYQKRLQSMAEAVEERATRPGADSSIYDGYRSKLSEVDTRMQRLAGAEQRAAAIEREYNAARLQWYEHYTSRMKAGLGDAAITAEERAAYQLQERLQARLKLAKAEVQGLGRVEAPGWREHQFGDLGNPHKPLCFVAGTLVKTPRGDRAIESLHAGDLVYAFDFEYATVAARRIVAVHGNWTEHVVRAYIGEETIEATRRHPFWLERERTWKDASALGAGDLLYSLAGPVAIDDVTGAAAMCPTLSLEVEEFHNFFVGRVGVLVHNGPEIPISAFADPTTYQAKFYKVIGPLPGGGRGVVYVGKTWQETIEKRFKEHIEKKGWSRSDYEIVEIDCPIKRKMTAFEVAVWERHYIELYQLENKANDISFNVEGQKRYLLNDPGTPPINAESYKEFRDLPFNRPCE